MHGLYEMAWGGSMKTIEQLQRDIEALERRANELEIKAVVSGVTLTFLVATLFFLWISAI